jgi:hypothetical protein
MNQHICIRCGQNKKPCSFFPGGNRLPEICGWNEEGRMIKPEWLEVPERKQTGILIKSIFPLE